VSLARTAGATSREQPAPSILRTALPPLTGSRILALEWLLRLATAGTFIGHGAYGAFMRKPGWYGFFDALGVSPATVDSHHLMRWVGGVEMVLGVLALVALVPALLLVMVVWKLGTEFVWYPLHGLPAWEFVERWGNYTAPLALLLLRGWPTSLAGWFRLRPARAERGA